MKALNPALFTRRWPLLGLAALLVAFVIALVLGPGAVLGQSAPSVSGVAVTSDAGDDDTYAMDEIIRVTLTFSEAVEVTGAPQLKIDMDPAEWGEKAASYESGGGTASLTFAHTVVEPNYSTQGIAVLANSLELNGGAIKSASSQTDAGLSHTGLGHDASHQVDWRQSPPPPSVSGVAVTSRPVAGDTYALGEIIRVTLTFTQTVNVTGAPQLKIDMDPAEWGEKDAAYESGGGTASLTFTHTVVEPNISTQGIAVLADTLELNGGTLKSVSSQADAGLSHVGLDHDASHKVDWQQSPPDPTPTPTPEPTPTPTPAPAPSVTGVAVTSDAGDDDTYALDDVIRVTVTFSEVVNVTGAPQLKIDMDPADWGEKDAAYESGSGTASLSFTHTVVEPNISTQGIAVLANSLALNGGTVRSASSNTDVDLAHTGLGHDAKHKVDWQQSSSSPTPEPTPEPTPGAAPSVVSLEVVSAPVEDNTYVLGDLIQVRASFTELVEVTGAPYVKIDMDPAEWGEMQAGYASGSGSYQLIFEHEVVEPNISTQGIAVLANSLTLNGGAIKSASSQTDADRSHDGLDHDSSHKVNWQLAGCVRVAPSSVSGLGIERAAVVSWTMPAQNADHCTASGFVIEARGSIATLEWPLTDAAARSFVTPDLPAGNYDFAVYVQYGAAKSEPEVAYSKTVPANCQPPTVTVERPGPYTVSGSWTYPDGTYGCQAGGLYVEFKKTTDGSWSSSHRVPDESTQVHNFLFYSMDAVEYQFRVRAIDARGVGKTEAEIEAIGAEWVRTSDDVKITPQGTFPGSPKVLTTDLVKGSGETLKRISTMRVLIEWDVPPALRDVEDYRIRYRTPPTATPVEIDVTAKNTSAVTPVTERGYVLEGLDRSKEYLIEVGVKEVKDGTTVIHWSLPTPASLRSNRFRVWWLEGFPSNNVASQKLFLKVDVNHPKSSASCIINGGNVNCPVDTLVNIEIDRSIHRPGDQWNVAAKATTGNWVDNGPIHAAAPRSWDLSYLGFEGQLFDLRQTTGYNIDASSSHEPGPPSIAVKNNNQGKAKVTWGEMTDVGTVIGYKVRHREQGTSEWTVSATLTAATREHTLTGLKHRVAYDVEVGACVGGCPTDDYVLYSRSHPTLGVQEDQYQAWWASHVPIHSMPSLVRSANFLFMAVDANFLAAAECFINGGTADNTTINCPPGTMVSLPVPDSPEYEVTATLESVAQDSSNNPLGTASPPARQYASGKNGAGEVNDMSASGGNGKIAVSWRGNVAGGWLGQTFTKDSKTWKIKEWNKNQIVYRAVGADAWTEVVVSADTDYYEITGLTAGDYEVQVWACVATVEVVNGSESGDLQTCKVGNDDPGWQPGLGSITPTVTVASTHTDLPGRVWSPIKSFDADGPDDNPGSADDNMAAVRWGPPPGGKAPVLYYDLRYKAWDQSESEWTETRWWFPQTVTLKCTAEFDCEYVGYWQNPFGVGASKDYDIEIRARNVNGHGPWTEAVAK